MFMGDLITPLCTVESRVNVNPWNRSNVLDADSFATSPIRDSLRKGRTKHIGISSVPLVDVVLR